MASLLIYSQESGYGHIPDRLRFVPVPVMKINDCQKSYRFYITPRMLCAGYATGGKDACNVSTMYRMMALNKKGKNIFQLLLPKICLSFILAFLQYQTFLFMSTTTICLEL